MDDPVQLYLGCHSCFEIINVMVLDQRRTDVDVFFNEKRKPPGSDAIPGSFKIRFVIRDNPRVTY